ncbi:MAG: flagellar biosynthetic protein FliR [Synergistales bacterium]|nr:flagellar biosynthetic protein FliR [Synergistales bacterium]
MTLSEPELLWLVVLFLSSIRFLGLLLVAPVFMIPSLPVPVRFWIALMLALIATPQAAPVPDLAALSDPVGILVAAVREFLVGAALGFLSGMPLYALQIAGRVIGVRMAFGMANIMDPMTQSQVSIISQLKYVLGMWYFFRWDGHLLLLRALVETFRLVPLGIPTIAVIADPSITGWLQEAMVLAMRLVLPFYGALILSDVGLGFVARTVPQMNIFILGLPIKVALGLFLLMVLLPAMVDVMQSEIEETVRFALSVIAG